MNSAEKLNYHHIHSGGAYYRQPRGLISVHGTEAIQFLDGMITNDVKTLEDGLRCRLHFRMPREVLSRGSRDSKWR